MQTSVADAIAAMQAAWDAGDAEAYAACFAEEASYVIFAGAVSRGRAAIQRDHEPVLERFQRGSRMRVEVQEVRMLGDDVAIALTRGGVGKGRRIPLDKVQTSVFRRQADGRWLCEAFQNTKRDRLLLRLMGAS